MCGIAGYIGSSAIDPNYRRNCLNLMNRRGPDSNGTFHQPLKKNRNVYLLHSRLRIIDLDDRANQPYQVNSKILIYNGEIYNYIELKQKLISLGHSFSTKSDTEVLLRLLTQFGWKGLDKCEGMWAFALYDKKNGTLMFSRDRFGEKPLYIYKDSKGLYFGSEVKFIFALKGKKLDVNLNHLYRYMVNGYKSLYKVKDSFFLGIEEVPAASVVMVDPDGNEQVNKYWQPLFNQNENMSYTDAVAETRKKLINSVKIRLRADVPLAFCMSGGIDSNSLISIAKKIFGYDVHGFTIVNEDARYEEQDLVKHAIHHLQIRHTEIPVSTGDFLSNLRALIMYHDAPIYTINYFAQWLLMENVSKHGYKISISGTAADELFSGYYDHHNAYLYEAKKTDEALYKESLKAWQNHIQPIVRNPYLKNPEIFINNPRLRDHIYYNSNEFANYLIKNWNESFTEKKFSRNLLRNRMLNELFEEVVPVILHEDDLNAMYFSIENRSPFLDRDLFEWSRSIPTKFLIKKGRAKAVLRDAMKNIVPDRILNEHRKVGFNVPMNSFLDTTSPDVMSIILDKSIIFEHIRREKIESLINKDYLLNSESKFLFNFLNCKLFLEEFS